MTVGGAVMHLPVSAEEWWRCEQVGGLIHRQRDTDTLIVEKKTAEPHLGRWRSPSSTTF